MESIRRHISPPSGELKEEDVTRASEERISFSTISANRLDAALTDRLAGIDTPYQIVECIGRGGMGVVYRARQLEMGRDVALKAMRGDLRHADRMRSEFVAEAKVTGALDHPNIVPVHALHDDAAAAPYFAMKLVRGRPWRELLESDEVGRARHLEILRAVGNAVAFAHSKGVINRDLKPSNVMVGRYGEVLVLDWGLACRFGDQTADDPEAATAGIRHASQVQVFEGTPNYMAPEMAEGRGFAFGPWTDVFLLGGILHEILTGEPPNLGTSLEEVLAAASRCEPRRFDDRTPRGLQEICRRALARDVADRHPDVPAFLEALADYERHRESEEIALRARTLRSEARTETQHEDAYALFQRSLAAFEQAVELWPGNRQAAEDRRATRIEFAELALKHGDLGLARTQVDGLDGVLELEARVESAAASQARDRRAARRQRQVLAAAAGLVIAVLGTAVVLIASSRDEERRARKEATDLAESNERLAEAEARARALAVSDALAARRVADFLIGVFEESDPIAQSGRTFGFERDRSRETSARDILDRGARQLRSMLSEQPLIRARLLDTIARVYLNLGLADEAEPLVKEALDLRRANLPERHADLAASLQTAARLRSVRGFPAAEEFGEALAMQRELLDEDDPVIARSSFNYAAQLAVEDDRERAHQELPRALELCAKRFGTTSREVALLRLAEAQLAIRENDMPAALAAVRTAAPIIDELRGSGDFSAIIELFLQAQIAEKLGQKQRCDALFDECTEKAVAAIGEDHYLIALVTTVHGAALNRAKIDLEKALSVNERALVLNRKVYGAAHPLVAGRVDEVMNALENLGRFDEVLALARETLTTFDGLPSTPLPFLARIRRSIGIQASRLGRHEEAAEALREAVDFVATKMSEDKAGMDRMLFVFEQVLLASAGENAGMQLVRADFDQDPRVPAFDVARVHARALRLVPAAAAGSADRRLADRCAALAVAALERAVAGMTADLDRIEDCEDFDALADREEFKAFIDRLLRAK